MKRILKIVSACFGIYLVSKLVRREKNILSEIRIDNLKRRYK